MLAALAACLCGCEEGAPFEVSGHVERSSGVGVVAEGEECVVAITNESRGGYPCRVFVECGGEVYYGGPRLGGYANCSVEDGRWVRATDHGMPARDGDPWMEFDVVAGRVRVRTPDREVDVRVDG